MARIPAQAEHCASKQEVLEHATLRYTAEILCICRKQSENSIAQVVLHRDHY